MRVAVEIRGSIGEPYLRVHHENVLAMVLRPGSMTVGLRRSAMRPLAFAAGEIGLYTPHLERWIGSADIQHLTLGISDAALMTACRGGVELRPQCRLVDARVGALVAAVNAERIAGFSSGRLFLDSIEQALTVALVDSYAVRRRSMRTYRGSLGPARLRKIKDLVHAKMAGELTLHEMAQSAGLSTAHFSQMFRKTTGESPYQYVLRYRMERAKEMLRTVEAHVLDVAVACGFKTQQHFARMFRRMCGASPTEYRKEFLR